MMPHVGIQMIPEEADLGEDAQILDAGARIELIRFDAGMASGATSVGIAIPIAGLEDTESGEPLLEGNIWVMAQTSLRALKAAVRALEQRDAYDQENRE